MVNTKLLKGEIVKSGLKQSEIAKKIGLSSQSLSAKLHNKSEFKLNEVIDLCQVLNIKAEKEQIFFAQQLD